MVADAGSAVKTLKTIQTKPFAIPAAVATGC
jgi:hypothetical protein